MKIKEAFIEELHEATIKSTRYGNLGSSDAHIVLKVGEKGVESLNRTEKKRLAVMLRQIEDEGIPTNAAMEAGHKFEAWYEQNGLDKRVKVEREKELRIDLGYSFGIIAHADFYVGKDKQVRELKYSKFATPEVVEKYKAQLQWYYLFPEVEDVLLIHGHGSVEPFEVESKMMVSIEKDEKMQETLRKGLEEIAEFVKDFVYNDGEASAEEDDILKEKARALERLKRDMEELKAQYDEGIADLMAKMEEVGKLTLKDDTYTVSYTAPSTSTTIDTKALLADHPELVGKYDKVSQRKASITFKLK